MTTITVIDVIRGMGIEPEPDLTWRVGAAVRILYEAEFGRLPEKELRPKTAGGGSHCFAAYPLSWRGKIQNVVNQLQTTKARQGILL